jgi:hypothetical protein
VIPDVPVGCQQRSRAASQGDDHDRADSRNPDPYKFAGVPEERPLANELIKAMINFELHESMGCEQDRAVAFRRELDARLNHDRSAQDQGAEA